MSLKLKRPYNGMQRIYDREKKEDGSYQDRTHVLYSKDGYSPKEKVWYEEQEKDGKKKKIRKSELMYGKSFEVMDEKYVLERHGAILEKA